MTGFCWPPALLQVQRETLTQGNNAQSGIQLWAHTTRMHAQKAVVLGNSLNLGQFPGMCIPSTEKGNEKTS